MLTADPIEKVSDIDPECLANLSITDPTSLACVLKVNEEIEELMLKDVDYQSEKAKTGTKSQKDYTQNKAWSSDNQIKAIRSLWWWLGPAVYCMEASACVGCISRVKSGGGYLNRLEARKERENKYTPLAVPCGTRATSNFSLGGIETYVRTGNCFGCTNNNTCSFKKPLEISSYAVDLIGDRILEIEHMVNIAHQQNAIIRDPLANPANH